MPVIESSKRPEVIHHSVETKRLLIKVATQVKRPTPTQTEERSAGRVAPLTSTRTNAMQPARFADAVRHFKHSANVRAFLISRRWPKGVACPACGGDKVYFDATRNAWECKTRHPKRKFSLKTGTIFEDSALGLDKWLLAIWLVANAKARVSSHELARKIGVTQKTAWLMLLRIRLAAQSEETNS